jgi:hypothetical protein
MNKKIFWDETTGSVYWIEDGDIFQAPMNIDNTANLEDSCTVEHWENAADEPRVRAKLA